MKTIFGSHLIAMSIFSLIASILLAFIKFDEKKDIVKYAVKLFLYMVGSVIVVSWIMYWI